MSKQGETLEERARELVITLLDIEPAQARYFTAEIDAAAVFARKLLEEARPYIAHKPDCADLFGEPCSCGLAELMKGWRGE